MKPIPNYPNYSIDTCGNVQNFKGTLLKWYYCGPTWRRYPYVRLYNKEGSKNLRVPRLVYLAHVGDIPEGMQIDHIDRNPNNNCITNLLCVTPKQNCRNRVFTKRGSPYGTFIVKTQYGRYRVRIREVSGSKLTSVIDKRFRTLKEAIAFRDSVVSELFK